jgi:hypothetical protein
VIEYGAALDSVVDAVFQVFDAESALTGQKISC